MTQRRKPQQVLYRRKQEGRTHYPKRLRFLLSQKPRLVVRFTNTRVLGQLVHFDAQGDRVEAAVDSAGLKKLGWPYSCKNLPAAYLAGFWLGRKATGKEAILDTGFSTPLPRGRFYAFLRGALDGGLQIPHQGEIFPPAERLQGNHITSYLQEKKKGTGQQFAQYLKSTSLGDVSKQVRAMKEALERNG